MTTYKELSDELSHIMAELQSGELGIDEAIAKYEQGAAIIKQLERHLKTAENKIIKIKDSLV